MTEIIGFMSPYKGLLTNENHIGFFQTAVEPVLE